MWGDEYEDAKNKELDDSVEKGKTKDEDESVSTKDEQA